MVVCLLLTKVMVILIMLRRWRAAKESLRRGRGHLMIERTTEEAKDNRGHGSDWGLSRSRDSNWF